MTIGDWWHRARLTLRLALLQRKARRQLRRGECSTVARLIADGKWAELDALTDGWVAP
jgi:hypothetical protein